MVIGRKDNVEGLKLDDIEFIEVKVRELITHKKNL